MKKAVLTTNDFNRLIYTTRDFTTTYRASVYVCKMEDAMP